MKLGLRKFTLHDSDATFSWLQDDELRRLFVMASRPGREGNREYWRKTLADPTQRVYAVIVDGEHVGNCGFKNIAADKSTGELWIYLGHAASRGKGWGRGAVELLLAEGKDVLGLERVVLHVAAFNRTARAVYEKAGFFEVPMPAADKPVWEMSGIAMVRMERPLNGGRVALMQPLFLPWQGFFALAAAADRFIILDDFQVSPQSYAQRNRLMTGPGRIGWATVPLSLSLGQSFLEAKVADDSRWRKKTAAMLRHSYGGHPFADQLLPFMEDWIASSGGCRLFEFNYRFLRFALDRLGHSPTCLFSSDFCVSGRRSTRVLSLLKGVGASQYLSAFGSFEYMREDGLFPHAKIDIRFLDYVSLPYAQKGLQAFVPSLSVLDAFCNLGFKATKKLITDGTQWLGWAERAARSDGGGKESEACHDTG